MNFTNKHLESLTRICLQTADQIKTYSYFDILLLGTNVL